MDKKRKHRRWTQEEYDYLTENYGEIPTEEIAKILDRSQAAIRAQADKLNIKSYSVRPYSEMEKEYVQKNYGKMTAAKIAYKLDRTPESVRRMAHFHGLTRKNKKWTEEENNFIKENFFKMKMPEMAKILERKESTVRERARTLGLSAHRSIPWTSEEDEIMKKYYQSHTAEEIKGMLKNRTYGAIKARASKLDLVARRVNIWTEYEDNFIKENYKTMFLKDIAKKLDRSVSAILNRGKYFGLSKVVHTADSHDQIVELSKEGKTVGEIAEELEINRHTLYTYMKNNGIPTTKTSKYDGLYAVRKAEVDSYEVRDVNFNTITVGEWYKRWYTLYRKESLAQVTRNKYEMNYIHILDGGLGDKRLKKVTREDVASYMKWYGAKRSKVTVQGHIHILKAMFKDAKVDGHIELNPAANVQPTYKEQNLTMKELKAIREEKKWLEMEEYQKLRYYLLFNLQRTLLEEPKTLSEIGTISKIPYQMYEMLMLIALKTGARTSEILAITKEDILFETSEINIDKTWNYKGHEKEKFLPTKTTQSIRTVVVDQETVDLLTKYIVWTEQHEIELDENTLFNIKNDKYYSSNMNNHLARTLKNLSIQPITMHKLRHTHASILIARGISLQVIAKRLGHTNTNMIQKVYGHLLKETEDSGNKMILELI